MSSSFWLLEVESGDFSKAEKEKTACKVVTDRSGILPFCPNRTEQVN
jgi:hypothetical protein